jgi:hypothetical protein
MWCLTLATNAVVTWTTEYHGLAVTALRRAGRDTDDAVLAHIWPTHHENVHFYGIHSVDVDGKLAKLDSTATGRYAPSPPRSRPGERGQARDPVASATSASWPCCVIRHRRPEPAFGYIR